MKAEAGRALGGRYRLLELLATGGMGEVWTAQDQAVGRVVAVKVLRDEYTGNLEFLRRLRTEARNSAALAHPNIAQMFDYGEEEGTGYLVMELVPGESLADLLDRQPVVPPGQLIPILADTARGLEHAHRKSVVHRDVKPGNILLESTVPGVAPKVKITDFGVSLAANQAPMTATGMVMGTAQYLSPEQAVGRPATPRSDLYALGVIAYEASVGKRPFSGKSPVDIAIAHVNDPMPPLPPTVDPGLAGVITRLLEKDPEDRHADAAELAAELDSLASAAPGARHDDGYSALPAGLAPADAAPAGAAPGDVVPGDVVPGRSVFGASGVAADGAGPGRLPTRAQRRATASSSTSSSSSSSSEPSQAHAAPPAGPAASVQPWEASQPPLPDQTPPLPPIRRTTRRPVSPVGQSPSAQAPPRVPRVTEPPRGGSLQSLPGSPVRRQAVLVQPQQNAPQLPGQAKPGHVGQSPAGQGRPPAVLIALLVIMLVVVLYLIVRTFANHAAISDRLGQMAGQGDTKVSAGSWEAGAGRVFDLQPSAPQQEKDMVSG